MFWKINKKIFSLPSFLLGIISISVFAGAVWAISLKITSSQRKNTDIIANKFIIRPAKAAEIYPEFICSCCGKTLDPDNICCGDMKQKIDYVNALISAGLSYDEVMLKTAKKFGFNSLAKTKTREEIKKKLTALAPADAPKIILTSANYDFGQINQADGIISTYFDFKNEGKSDLIINNLSTSCGCTSASIVYQGEEGPTFTMPGHGQKNPQNWSVSIAPDDTAQLKIYYDPNAHGPQKEDILLITRTISIISNDPVEFEKQVRIELQQVP